MPDKSLGINVCEVVLPIPEIGITFPAATSGILLDNWIISSLTFLTAYTEPVSKPTTVDVVGEYLTNSPLVKLWFTIVILSVISSTFELNAGSADVNVLLLLVATIS